MCIPGADQLLHGETQYNYTNWSRRRGEEGAYEAPFEFHDRFLDGAAIS